MIEAMEIETEIMKDKVNARKAEKLEVKEADHS